MSDKHRDDASETRYVRIIQGLAALPSMDMTDSNFISILLSHYEILIACVFQDLAHGWNPHATLIRRR